MATAYYARPIQTINVADISRNVLDRLIAMSDMNQFRRDLHYLHSKGISQRKVAKTLNVPYGCFWNWMHRHEPTIRSMYYILVVREWANALRENEIKTGAGSQPQPHVVQSS